jgi:hypothetical protein
MMSKDKEEKQKLTGPWRSIHGAVWLIGLAILALNNWWWPGILVLIAISTLVEALIKQYVPDAIEKTEPPPMPSVPPVPPVPPMPLTSQPSRAASSSSYEHRPELLPTTCPNCGGPTRGHEVKWTGPQSADCPYCGVNLPMKKS